MSLQDRVAFACTYLDDRQLCAHISSLTRQVVGRGDISGLFLTGLPNEGLALLANYVNMVSACSQGLGHRLMLALFNSYFLVYLCLMHKLVSVKKKKKKISTLYFILLPGW